MNGKSRWLIIGAGLGAGLVAILLLQRPAGRARHVEDSLPTVATEQETDRVAIVPLEEEAAIPEPGADRTLVTTDDPAAADETPALRGRVVDETGTPVFPFAMQSMEDGAEGTIGWSARISTDEEGGFSITSRKGGRLLFSVRSSGFLPLSSHLDWDAEESMTVPDLVLTRGVVLAGRVVDADGDGVAGARLFHVPTSPSPGSGAPGSAKRDERCLGESDDDGAFHLEAIPVGLWQVRVTSGGFLGGLFSGNAHRAGLDEEHVFALPRFGKIDGRVETALGSPAGDITVVAFLVPEQAAPTGVHRSHLFQRATTDEDGNFSFPTLPATEDGMGYVLQCRRDAMASVYISEPTEVMPGDPFVVLRLTEEATIAFHLIDASTREPLRNPQIVLRVARPHSGEEYLHVTKEGLLGRDSEDGIVIGPVPLDAPRAVRVIVEAEGYSTWETPPFDLAPGEKKSFGEIAMTPLPPLRVTVLDRETRRPVSGARVVAAPPYADVNAAASMALPAPKEALTDSAGIAQIFIPLGESRLITAFATGYAPCVPLRCLPPTTTAPSELILELARGRAIHVFVHDPEGDPVDAVEIRYFPASTDPVRTMMGYDWRKPPSKRTGIEGEVVFSNLPAGTYYLRVVERGTRDAEAEWEPVYLAADQDAEHRIERPMQVHFHGAITAAGEPLAQAWVARIPVGREEHALMRDARVMKRLNFMVQADAFGRFDFGVVAGVLYNLRIEHADLWIPYEVRADMRFEESPVLLACPDLQDVCCTVRSPDGEPIGGALLSVSREKDLHLAISSMQNDVTGRYHDRPAFGPTVVRSGPEGKFVLRGLPLGQELFLVATAPRHAQRQLGPIVLDRGPSPATMEVVLESAGTLDVHVVSSTSLGSSLSVVVVPMGDDAAQAIPQRKRLRGTKCTFDNLAPGPWTVKIDNAFVGQEATMESDEETVQITGGESAQVEIRWP